MSRSFAIVALAVGACLVLGPQQSLADVLQIGPDGPQWVSGRLAQPAAVAGAPDPALTQAGASVGPLEWQAAVAAIASKYEISPVLLEAVVWQESRWRPTATSSAGAHGLAQLMPGTARQMGVDITDPGANLEGGARYLRMQLDAFDGDVEKALAAYNAGPGRVIQAGGVPRIRETQGYVAAVMARMAERVRR